LRGRASWTCAGIVSRNYLQHRAGSPEVPQWRSKNIEALGELMGQVITVTILAVMTLGFRDLRDSYMNEYLQRKSITKASNLRLFHWSVERHLGRLRNFAYPIALPIASGSAAVD
jgi:hypothetical protein